MNISNTIKAILKERGIKQTWVVKRMNLIAPDVAMDKVKFSAIVCGIRKMSGEELLAFCKAIEENPDIFLKAS
ncbi:MAG: hypothetical protein HFG19_04790 [Oscillospiraceae bacterium]|nr:hypothetical protein [Oscillospiraceae bacterium]